MTQPRLLGGRYELDGIVGRGGMAEVFRARDIRLDRIVGVKTLRDDLARDQTFQARFRREAQSAASLNHPSIVAVYDTGEDMAGSLPVPYIVMEFVDGRTLRDLLRDDRRLLPERAAEITDGVLRALDYSHRNGIVHRDIKPGNVMLTRSGDVKVMDFGIARAVSDSQMTMTQTAQVIGTAQYLSPEQARGERVDARSDLYSTGCLLYELLTGRPPFTGDSPVAIAYQHVKEDPVPPSQVDREVPGWADAIVLKAMQKDPGDRYQSAGEMRNDIQRALSGAPVAAPMLADGYGAGTRRMGSTATQVAGRTAGIPPYRYGPEDGGPDGPPQRQRRVWPWVVLATVVVVLIAAIVLIKYVTGNSGGVAVPNVINSPLTAAEQSITSVGLKVGTVTAKQSASVTKDLVISTNPAFGSNEPKGSPVSIVYSIGPKPVATKLVPPVVGETRGPAISALRKAGFQVAVIAGQSPTAPANTVISQTPSGNTSQPVGSTVTISVTGATVTVPTSVLGMTQAQAQSLLSSAPYNYNVTVQPGAGNGAVGTVYQTSPPVGTALPSGSAITIFVVAPQVTTPPTSPSSTPSSTPSGTASP
ncbi:MAG TPA: Stk1 family PASTA domain-containing Ser/Thr kinase [Streptosporangiaceae bacterium]|jgi:beta-lactam-binding protein with PASTA domain/tRNA A-37 threonylcarbamoyl transferase component Bud32|nr:Stk1 family PASTA domain-containing Ser/Thr kinase [Streptosporangiaceae bacterium]